MTLKGRREESLIKGRREESYEGEKGGIPLYKDMSLKIPWRVKGRRGESPL